MPPVAESSTAIRAALRDGRRPQGLRPEVEREIRRRGLYGARPE
jgi:nicotinic acid mononucleotide adenylyltransferase